MFYAILTHKGPLLGRRSPRQMAGDEANAHVVSCRQLRVAH